MKFSTMVNSWSYLVMVLCLSVTSSRIIRYRGNEVYHHGNDVSDVRLEKFKAPPISNGLIIDQFGYLGNSDVKSSSGTFQNYHNFSDEKLDDKRTPKPDGNSKADDDKNPKSDDNDDEDICTILCKVGEGGIACLCDWTPLSGQLQPTIVDVNRDHNLAKSLIISKLVKNKSP